MKLQFDANLAYQEQDVSSVVDLFRGQTPKQSNFTVAAYSGQMGLLDSEHGIGNRLELDEEDILQNLQEIQLQNGIAQTKSLTAGKYDFDIEMETGTGKTYVYLRAIFELNKAYGFSKFIIVVPSIAIKEGVYKSLQITEEHFKNLYDNSVYDYFIYDSGKLEQVRSYAVNDHISIMVINIDAFRKSFDDPEAVNKANIIHRQNDKLNGMKPIELIKETHPFVIIDEPQSVDTTPKSKEAIASLNPLCAFRYSATHVDKHNLIYKLDAVDSFDRELVKQIEVASFASKDYHNNAYLLLKSVDNKKSPITAKIEMDVNERGVTKHKPVTVRAGDDLYEKSGGRDVYEDYIIAEIYCEKGNEYVSFTSKPDILRSGVALGDIDDLAIKEQQIKKTIEEHLNKELILNPKGIKVLSLFFIDRVANYRYYDENGNPQKGIYAQLFEKQYRQLIEMPKYHTLFKEIDVDTTAEDVHNGYFAIDKKVKRADGTKEYIFKETSGLEGKSKSDEEGYSLIMRDKERLLSFDTKLRFIFSHSALREGWDNPNVFQICTLNETRSEVKKRQEIGRGLRLCVNQDGERQYGFNINTLTVMANESYEEFAAKLQREYETDEGICFGVLELHTFANISVKQPDGSYSYLGVEESEAIYRVFEQHGYIDSKGHIGDTMKKALKDIHTTVSAANMKETLPDIITYLQNHTNLTRKTIVDILIRSRTLDLFKKNPQHYMEDVARIITSIMRLMIVDGIKYTRLGDTEYYAQELFDTKELIGYFERNMIASEKSVYDYVVFDSANEESFARSFEDNNDIKFYTKLPDWFKISTLLGSYNPDWAVLIEKDGERKLYFVLETKANILPDALRPTESAKIACGYKHFEALDQAVVAFEKADSFDKFMEKVL